MFLCGVMKMGCLGGRLGWSLATGGGEAGSGVVVVETSSTVVVVVTSSGVVIFSLFSPSALFSHSSLVTENDEDTTV